MSLGKFSRVYALKALGAERIFACDTKFDSNVRFAFDTHLRTDRELLILMLLPRAFLMETTKVGLAICVIAPKALDSCVVTALDTLEPSRNESVDESKCMLRRLVVNIVCFSPTGEAEVL